MPGNVMLSTETFGLGFLKTAVVQQPTGHQSACWRWKVTAFVTLVFLPLSFT